MLKPTILLIGPIACRNLSEKMIALDYQIVPAESNREVARFVSEIKFSLIFIQLNLPTSDLVVCINKLKRTRNSKTPTIGLLTGDRIECNESFCLRAGVSDYLRMPVTTSRLRQAVARWVI